MPASLTQTDAALGWQGSASCTELGGRMQAVGELACLDRHRLLLPPSLWRRRQGTSARRLFFGYFQGLARSQ